VGKLGAWALAVALGGLVACTQEIGGSSSKRPEELYRGLSPEAAAAVKDAWTGIDPAKLLDYHCHMTGNGSGGTGNFVNAMMLSWFHPFRHLEYEVLLSAAGIKNVERADQEYVERLVSLVRNIPNHGKYCLLAFDKHYRRDGTVDLERTGFYVSNEYVWDVAEKYPDVFRPTMSIHPYRPDAIAELEKFAKRGGRLIKWLPNAQGMDPSDASCVPFYKRMKELNVALLSHAGEEKAVDARGQPLGNPLLLRGALDQGVRVIVAHCASLGEDEDVDSPERKPTKAFELFLRLMEEKKYEGLVFGEISATTLANRCGTGALETLLRRTDLHARLVNGSDYPLPAANVLIRLGKLQGLGFIDAAQHKVLKEIYESNPLLFDFMVKRMCVAPGTKTRFADSVFLENASLP
jgi:predicted TIM-barrel fold metal-dependent hydrolase